MPGKLIQSCPDLFIKRSSLLKTAVHCNSFFYTVDMLLTVHMFVNMVFWQLHLQASPIGVGVRLNQIPHPQCFFIGVRACAIVKPTFTARFCVQIQLCPFFLQISTICLYRQLHVVSWKKHAIDSTVCSHKLFTL